MTPSFTVISCISSLFASSVEPDNRRSGAVPQFSIVRYPPATFAPFGVARLQAWLMTRFPETASPARNGCDSRQEARAAQVNPRMMACMICLSMYPAPPSPGKARRSLRRHNLFESFRRPAVRAGFLPAFELISDCIVEFDGASLAVTDD